MKDVFSNTNIQNIGVMAAKAYLKSKGHVLINEGAYLKSGEVHLTTTRKGIIHLIEIKSIKAHDTANYKVIGEECYETEKDNLPGAKMRKLKGLCREFLAYFECQRIINGDYGRMQHVCRGQSFTQVDGLIVRLLFEADKLIAAKARYFPFIS